MIKAANKLIIFVLLFVCVSGACYASTWKLYASYPTPGPNPRGYRGEVSGFVVQDGTSAYIYRVAWPRIISSFAAPGGRGAWGLCLESGWDMYLSNNRTSWIYHINSTGSVYSSFRCPVDGPADMERRWYQGTLYYLHVAIPGRNIIAVVNQTTGSLVSTFSGPGSRPTACGGPPFQFFVADSGTHAVYEEGKVVISGITTPVGFDYTAITDGWVDQLFVVDDATDRIYFYRDSSGVAPASLGRVKALFR